METDRKLVTGLQNSICYFNKSTGQRNTFTPDIL